MLLQFECYAGSGTSILGKALETSQGTQAKQKTASRRGLGNGIHNGTREKSQLNPAGNDLSVESAIQIYTALRVENNPVYLIADMSAYRGARAKHVEENIEGAGTAGLNNARRPGESHAAGDIDVKEVVHTAVQGEIEVVEID